MFREVRRVIPAGSSASATCRKSRNGRRGQAHDHAANRNQHPGTQFQQTFTACPDLSSRTVGVRGVQTSSCIST